MILVNILGAKDYEVGSQPPDGHLAWHEWAGTQHKAGLRQKTCIICSFGVFPQEIGEAFQHTAKNSRGETVKLDCVYCLKYAELKEAKNGIPDL